MTKKEYIELFKEAILALEFSTKLNYSLQDVYDLMKVIDEQDDEE